MTMSTAATLIWVPTNMNKMTWCAIVFTKTSATARKLHGFWQESTMGYKIGVGITHTIDWTWKLSKKLEFHRIHTLCALSTACQWNTCCTAAASSTLQFVVGVTTHLPISEQVCAPQGPRDPEGAHKCVQRNRNSAQPGVNQQSTVTFTMSKCERKHFSRNFLIRKMPNERFLWHTCTYKYTYRSAWSHNPSVHTAHKVIN